MRKLKRGTRKSRDNDVGLFGAEFDRKSKELAIIGELDRDLARRLEPRSPTPDSRIRALGRLREAGMGATYVAATALRLRISARQRYLPFIEQEFPHLAERYRNTYAKDFNAGKKYRQELHNFFSKLCRKYGVEGSAMRDDDDEGDFDSVEIPPRTTRIVFFSGAMPAGPSA